MANKPKPNKGNVGRAFATLKIDDNIWQFDNRKVFRQTPGYDPSFFPDHSAALLAIGAFALAHGIELNTSDLYGLYRWVYAKCRMIEARTLVVERRGHLHQLLAVVPPSAFSNSMTEDTLASDSFSLRQDWYRRSRLHLEAMQAMRKVARNANADTLHIGTPMRAVELFTPLPGDPAFICIPTDDVKPFAAAMADELENGDRSDTATFTETMRMRIDQELVKRVVAPYQPWSPRPEAPQSQDGHPSPFADRDAVMDVITNGRWRDLRLQTEQIGI